MQTRGLTLRGAILAEPASPGAALVLSTLVAAPPRGPSKERLTRVPLRDLELEAQYTEIREALRRYSDEAPPEPQSGEVKCGKCGSICSEEVPSCPCGNFLHFHQIFTCPDCSRLLERDARDCNGCGSRFWSPVNPPFGEITQQMVSDYLEQFERNQGT